MTLFLLASMSSAFSYSNSVHINSVCKKVSNSMLHLGSQSDEDQSLVLFVMKIRQLLGAVKQSKPARDTIT